MCLIEFSKVPNPYRSAESQTPKKYTCLLKYRRLICLWEAVVVRVECTYLFQWKKIPKATKSHNSNPDILRYILYVKDICTEAPVYTFGNDRLWGLHRQSTTVRWWWSRGERLLALLLCQYGPYAELQLGGEWRKARLFIFLDYSLFESLISHELVSWLQQRNSEHAEARTRKFRLTVTWP